MVDSSSLPPLTARLGINIAQRRKALGLTQAELAEQMSMEPESISRFERGATLPSLATLEKLADILDTTIAALLAEYPEQAYPEARRISALMQPLSPDERQRLTKIIEDLCDMLVRHD
jgi:transcriptional regulator with XRE-family HTH domain